MYTYLLLLRGINVGGKNKLSMAELTTHLTSLGFSSVTTYIASGNVVLQSDKPADQVKSIVEQSLPKQFKLDSQLIKILVLTPAQLRSVVKQKPPAFGDSPDTYHSDVIFLMDIPVDQALAVFQPKEGVDTIWPGPNVIYSQRLSAQRTKSRLNKIMVSPLYKSMTIRTWNTTIKLLEIIKNIEK